MNAPLGDKSLDCLAFIAGNPYPTYAGWMEAYEALCDRWSQKAVQRNSRPADSSTTASALAAAGSPTKDAER